MDAFSFIGTFFDFILSLFPHLYIIPPHLNVVKHKAGGYNVLLTSDNGVWLPPIPLIHWRTGRTGIHIYWPIFTLTTEYDVRWDWMSTLNVTVTDGIGTKAVTASVSYRITDPMKSVTSQKDIPELIFAATESVIMVRAIKGLELDSKESVDLVNEKLTTSGVEVGQILITDKATVGTVYRIFGGTGDQVSVTL